MEITWLGWDGFKIISSDKVIYLDPFIGEYVDKADIVLISHSHHDHYCPEILEKIRNRNTVIITSKENKKNINGIGLEPGDQKDFNFFSVEACHAYNTTLMRAPGVPYHPKNFGVGWIIEIEGKRVYFMGDTELILEMNDIKNIDVMLVPISGKYVMDVNEAIKTVKLIKPKVVIPMHYGKAAAISNGKLKDMHLNADTDFFEKELKDITKVIVLKHNETFSF